MCFPSTAMTSTPARDMDFVKNAGVDLPILLGEYHCGALDRGADGHRPEGAWQIRRSAA